MITAPHNVVDFLSFAPPLAEALLQQFLPAFSFGRLDLRWVKLLRSMRVMRIGLLGAELQSLHLSTKRGGWLTAGANFRLVQLATSIFMLLFAASAVIQVVEQLPFHKALYLVATTLSTVGYGDVVATSFLGRACILAMIAVGIVLIPVQAATFYSEVSARRVVRGALPDWRGTPFVLLSARLTEVRAFSDLFAEFQQALGSARFPSNTKLVALCNRPSFEFTAFQELHERAVTLVEGSAVSGQDLVTVGAERAQGIMLLADRFTTDPESEDLGILFQVWACKAYTKRVPLFVQTLRQSTVYQVGPFLDPEQDVVMSMEETRYRLLALSAVTPGASTLLGNLLRSSAVRPLEAREPTLAGRRWLREYVDGCEYSLFTAPIQRHLIGKRFADVALSLFEREGLIMVGVVGGGGSGSVEGVRLNPAHEILDGGSRLLVLGPGEREVRRALSRCTDIKGGGRDEAGGEGAEYSVPVAQHQEQPELEACGPDVGLGNMESDSVDHDDLPCRPDFGYHDSGDADSAQQSEPPFESHFILCGHEGSIVPFMAHLRAAQAAEPAPIVVLAPTRPQDLEPGVHFVCGSPADGQGLRAAGAGRAKALVYLARGSRPVKTAQATGAAVEVERSTREAVLADANALLTCYGVGEESGATLTHAVVELLFTTSIEFLQPGLLLKGVSAMYGDEANERFVPRKAWRARAQQQQEAVAEGLAEWQCNPYYAAGRATVPALMDAFATQAFFTRGLLVDVLAQMCGETMSGGRGAALRLVQVPIEYTGRTYGDLFRDFIVRRDLICIGLYRRKSENVATRLSYVVATPPGGVVLEATDRAYVVAKEESSKVLINDSNNV